MLELKKRPKLIKKLKGQEKRKDFKDGPKALEFITLLLRLSETPYTDA